MARDFSDPLSLLAAYRATLRPGIVYVADLDRILGRGDNDALLGRLVEAAPEARFLWDGGIPDAAAIAGAARHGRVTPVLGTETLRSIEELQWLHRHGAGSRAVLSLDLVAGGGIAGLDDLLFLRDAGFSGALLATALHDGLISPDDLRREGFLRS